jgi:hypothetical protein
MFKGIFYLSIVLFFLILSCQYFELMSKEEWNKKSTTSSGSSIVLNSNKSITSFSFTKALNSALPSDISGSISGTTITVTVPYGTAITNLIASFTTTGMSVKIDSTPQISGSTANNFSSSKTYIVTAVDGSTAGYTVTVSIGSILNLTTANYDNITGPSIADQSSSFTITSGTIVASPFTAGTVMYGTSSDGNYFKMKILINMSSCVGLKISYTLYDKNSTATVLKSSSSTTIASSYEFNFETNSTVTTTAADFWYYAASSSVFSLQAENGAKFYVP